MEIALPADHGFLTGHSRLLLESYRRLLGRELPLPSGLDIAEALFEAPFALVSHGTEAEPIFNYGNRTALTLFAMSWQAFTALPSQRSAESGTREGRERLLAEVKEKGYIEDYSGVRIAADGSRFRINNVVIWNIHDDQGVYRGQAAQFSDWQVLD